MIDIGFRRLPHGTGLPLPAYHSDGAAGMDLHAAVADETPLLLQPGERACVPTGLAISLPSGYEAQIRPRSGLARNHGVTILNAPGTIDSDYRGELQVLLINHGDAAFEVTRGMRIAQMVVASVAQAQWAESCETATTTRGENGFGSTGIQTPPPQGAE